MTGVVFHVGLMRGQCSLMTGVVFHVGLMWGQCSLMTGVVSCRSNEGPVLTDDWCCYM